MGVDLQRQAHGRGVAHLYGRGLETDITELELGWNRGLKREVAVYVGHGTDGGAFLLHTDTDERLAVVGAHYRSAHGNSLLGIHLYDTC